jgi:rhodanese-related sulfurtransferase
VGLDDVAGYLQGGMPRWVVAGLPVARIPTISVHDVQRSCETHEKPLTILDVRALGEWNVSHIDGAVHMPMPTTRSRHGELDPNSKVILVCKSGARASTAGSILQQRGFRDLAVMAGGMTAWTAAGLAPECAMCALTHGPRSVL